MANSAPVGKHSPSLLEVLLPRRDDRVEHPFEEQEVAHPFGDDHVEFMSIQLGYIFQSAFQEGYRRLEGIFADDVHGLEGYGRKQGI